MRLKKRVGMLVVLAMGSGLGGCGLNTPYPDRALFTIDAGVPGAGGGEAKALTLRVRRVIAVAPFGGNAFVYRTGANELKTDYYNAFAAPPAELVTADVVQWLRGSHLFAAVEDSNGGKGAEWSLEGRLQELSVDTTAAGGAEAVMTLEFVLMDEREAETRVLMEKTYTERVKIGGGDAKGAAAAWSEGCRRVFEKLTGDLAGMK